MRRRVACFAVCSPSEGDFRLPTDRYGANARLTKQFTLPLDLTIEPISDFECCIFGCAFSATCLPRGLGSRRVPERAAKSAEGHHLLLKRAGHGLGADFVPVKKMIFWPA
jgi:hypothetical protein